MSLLEVKNLKTYFYTDAGVGKAVDDVSFSLDRGKTLGIVGESGCGKSVTSLSIMRLVDPVVGRYEGGQILFDGQDILQLPEKDMQKLRGDRLSMIFQEPMTSLNPVFTIGYQISESLMLHKGLDKKQARRRSIELLEMVGIPEAAKRVDEYPHQLSGGMRQRVMIAMALSGDPELLIADEPTTALDVTIQAQILELIQSLQKKMGMAVILVTHDLGVIADLCDNIVVMYGNGRRGGCDVRGRHRGNGPHAGAVRRPQASLHHRPDEFHPRHQRGGHAAAHAGGPGAQPVRHALGLPLRAALPVRLPRVRGEPRGADDTGGRPAGALQEV